MVISDGVRSLLNCFPRISTYLESMMDRSDMATIHNAES